MSNFFRKKTGHIFCFLMYLLLVLPGMAGAASYSKIVAFGDSLTDHGGLYKALKPVSPDKALVTWSNGDVWVDYLKNRLNADLDDRAIAGATAEGHEDESVKALIDSGTLPDLSFRGQVDSYIASNPSFDPEKTLFTMWIGGNDLLEFNRKQSIYPTPEALINGVVTVIIQSMQKIYAGGGKHFLVMNLPDVGYTPYFVNDPLGKGPATLFSTMFNNVLWAKVDEFAAAFPEAHITKFDVFTYLHSVIDAGIFPDTTGTYMIYDANGNRTLEHNETASNYLFWDMIHPTTKTHGILANGVAYSLGADVNVVNPIVAITGFNISSPNPVIQPHDPVNISVSASATGNTPVKYEYYYCGSYGTDEYATAAWQNVSGGYKESGSWQYSFENSGYYIVVVRAVTDPSNISDAFSMVGAEVSVGGDGNDVHISDYTSTATPDVFAGWPVKVSVNASVPNGSPVNYKFFYCANYGSSTYDTTEWKTVQEYSASNSCTYSFSNPGNYIVVARAVKEAETGMDEKIAALPIVGSAVSVNPVGLIQKSEYRENYSRLKAVFQTSKGTFEAELYAAECPETVWNFVNLAEGRQLTPKNGNYYDGLTFHRVIDGFMIQGGCPFGNGSGGPGYRFNDEINASLKHDSAGILSMANSGTNTNGSQFFVTLGPQSHLDGKHTVFGKITSGMDVVSSIGDVQTDKNDKPLTPVVMEKVTIVRP